MNINYKIEIDGKHFDLPKKTLKIDEQIEEISNLFNNYCTKKMTRRQVLNIQYDFVNSIIPNFLEPLDEIDTNFLTDVCYKIIDSYNQPILDMQTRTLKRNFGKILNSKEFNKAIQFSKQMKQ